YLSDFTYEVRYIKGSKNTLADALSRVGHVVVKGPKIKLDEHEADLLTWRGQHIETRAVPMKPSADCPRIAVVDSEKQKKTVLSADREKAVEEKQVSGKRKQESGKRKSVKGKKVMVISKKLDQQRKLLNFMMYKEWIEKVSDSQKKYLSDKDGNGKSTDGLILKDGLLIIPEQDSDLVKEILSAAHDNTWAGHLWNMSETQSQKISQINDENNNSESTV
ncbi:hypothetical protein ADUPG1_001359, partial [Aduncisulcus paluster]